MQPKAAAVAPNVDLAEAARFLDLITEGEPVTFQTFDDGGKSKKLARILHGDLDQHAAQLVKLNDAGAGVFFAVNFTDRKGRTANNVTGVRTLVVDLDGAPIAPVLSCGLDPQAVVESSPGRFHAYWLVADCPPDQFERWQKALAARFDGDPVVCDLPRVMRIPGFIHRKAAPFRSRIVQTCALQPYALAELVERLKLATAGQNRGLPRDRKAANTTAAPRGANASDAFSEGQRNAGLTSLAGKLRRQGLSAAEIEGALMAANRTRCTPPLPDGEVTQIARSVARYAPHPAAEASGKVLMHPAADAWPDPLLPGAVRPPEIPANILPGWVGEMAEAVSAWSQTPPAMAVLMALSVLAAVLHRRFEVAPWADDYIEPLALWTLTALPSGSRKTAVINTLAAPLVAWEKAERDRLRAEIGRVHALREVLTKRIEKLKSNAGAEECADKRAVIQTEIQKAREEMPSELVAPRLFSGDITSERLQQLLVEHDEKMAIFSDEGGIFLVMAGMYSGGIASLDVFLQGYSGSPMRVDRAGRLAHLDRPTLTFGLALQPGILADVAKTRRFRDSGLLARFLYAVPESNLGKRDVRARVALAPDARLAWNSGIATLLSDMLHPIGKPRVLSFSAEAREPWLAMMEKVEANIGENQRYASIADWMAKLGGQTARIAALIELATHGTRAEVIGAEAVERALSLCRLLIQHAEAAFRLMGTSDAEGDAVALLRWLQNRKLPEFDRRDAQKAMEGRFRTVERLLTAVHQLQDWYVLGPERKRVAGERGGRPSPFYQVNPKVLSIN